MPIDQDFKKKYPVISKHNDHEVRGEVKPPQKLRIHGTQVALDQDLCNGNGVCITVCPVGVFDWID